MTFDKSKPMPEWITRPTNNENTRRGQLYYAKLYTAQPPWANRKAINNIYREARYMRRIGFNVTVDHVIPLSHPLICGLHVPSNLKIVTAKHNREKSNVLVPGLCEQYDLFDPPYFELEYQI